MWDNDTVVKEIINKSHKNEGERTVFVVLDMHPGLMDPTETLGTYINKLYIKLLE